MLSYSMIAAKLILIIDSIYYYYHQYGYWIPGEISFAKCLYFKKLI